MKRAVIFDYGGVLMKTVDYGPRHAWDERLGLPQGSIERVVHGSASWLKAMTNTIALADYWADVAGQLRLDSDAVRQLARDFYRGDVLDETLIAYIRELRRRGYPVALLSNASLALENELIEQGIAGLFDPLVISAHIGVLKPEADAFQVALDRLGRPAEVCVFIDDMAANVAGAQAVGLHAIHYTPALDLPAALEPLLVAS